MSAPPARPKPLDWGLLALLGFVWGGSFLGVDLSLHSLSPLWVAGGRISLAALLLVGVTLLFGAGLPDTRTPTGRRIWLHCLGMGLFTNAIPFSLLSWGQQVVSSSFAGITMAVVPLFVLPLSHVFVPGERLSRARLIGFMIGFAGVVLLIGGDGFGSGAPTAVAAGTMLPAQIGCVAATCCYACGAIITRLCPPVNTMSFASGGLLCGSLFILPLAAMVDGIPGDISATSWGGVLFLALLPTGLATIILTFVIRRAGPPFLSLVNYQVPVWAVLIGVTVLGEPIPVHFLAALATILTGLAISQRLHRPAAA